MVMADIYFVDSQDIHLTRCISRIRNDGARARKIGRWLGQVRIQFLIKGWFATKRLFTYYVISRGGGVRGFQMLMVDYEGGWLIYARIVVYNVYQGVGR